MNVITKKFELLDCIYHVFDQWLAAEYETACRKGCAACCTGHVTGTAIEAYRLLQAVKKLERNHLFDRLTETAQSDLFRPRLSPNALALACLTRREPPEEEPPEDQTACPLLEDDLCLVYEDRPFGCRAMISFQTCRPGGLAEAPSEVVVVAAVCQQIIEHLDLGGAFGNLTDLVLALKDRSLALDYTEGRGLARPGLAPTRPVPGFLVHPDQEAAIQNFLEKLFQSDSDGRTFREKMSAFRNSPF